MEPNTLAMSMDVSIMKFFIPIQHINISSFFIFNFL